MRPILLSLSEGFGTERIGGSRPEQFTAVDRTAPCLIRQRNRPCAPFVQSERGGVEDSGRVVNTRAYGALLRFQIVYIDTYRRMVGISNGANQK